MKPRRKLFSVTIKDCKVETFCSGGPGGQHQNKTQSGVRITHTPSGAIGESREHRSQHRNKQAAWKRMGESKPFQMWARVEAARLQGHKTVDELVDEAMKPDNLRTEIRGESGRWQPVVPGELRDSDEQGVI